MAEFGRSIPKSANTTCKLRVLGFPCAQFGNQEPAKDFEIRNGLKYVRPGNGFVPNFNMFSKTNVNGINESTIFTWLKKLCPRPNDIIVDGTDALWSPIRISDIHWNFEKFLIDHKGQPYKRFSDSTMPLDFKEDIKYLIGQCMQAKRKQGKGKIPSQ